MGLPRINGEVGKLWANPELRFTPGGKAVCSVPLVFNKRKKNQAGEWEDAGSVFVRATVWDQQGENCAESLAKGDEVIVTGELSVREYERKDGSKGTSIEANLYAIGPSLKWHSAKVNRVSRASDGTAGGSPDPWGSDVAPGQPVDGDEPPF